ncbi:SPL family radical SAM protein [Alicyclobacillus acidocaldarius]|uniref:Radical SAM domain protein n=1 Tax=Alicyclobacillus acidocaldarius subsp. acidocaldarius (strain ATCC 27009 / DSM 446 / BCRC 14685 / JCM 5260 / KCTC 1825 / NBRC 15652 / NCIMB 11725 / NRRL B-14509 / 104-IA) TaxID=521098 RepID=C8WXP7_ALIAD|nr:radical SAM protein [Alicyclobacillus acidocaldarius]ACV58868.1 Radical SAM domain protein [Alicyclobacillus acidocaldarius subsp. acidocaldarius DSM 446]
MTGLGHSPSRLLTPTGGYLRGYDYTLNPYIGCAYGCKYCYVQALPVARFRSEPWGSYAEAKRIDPEDLLRELRGARRRGGTRIFMSSSTDPYQPAEWRVGATRSILLTLQSEPELVDFLFVQTRSPLVARDAEILASLRHRVLVSVTLETDREDVRRRFTPRAPTVRARIRAIEALRAHAIPVQVAVAPILPSSPDFPRLLAALSDFVAIDDWFIGDGANGRRSRALGVEQWYLPDERDAWYRPGQARDFAELLAERMPRDRIFLHQQGFLPLDVRRPFDERIDPEHA